MYLYNFISVWNWFINCKNYIVNRNKLYGHRLNNGQSNNHISSAENRNNNGTSNNGHPLNNSSSNNGHNDTGIILFI